MFQNVINAYRISVLLATSVIFSHVSQLALHVTSVFVMLWYPVEVTPSLEKCIHWKRHWFCVHDRHAAQMSHTQFECSLSAAVEFVETRSCW